MTDAETDAMQCLEDFMSAPGTLVTCPAFAATFNYPSVRIASGRIRILESPASHLPDLFDRMVAAGWHRSAWLRRNILHSSDDKVHFDTRFGRYARRWQHHRRIRLHLHRQQAGRPLGRPGRGQFRSVDDNERTAAR